MHHTRRGSERVAVRPVPGSHQSTYGCYEMPVYAPQQVRTRCLRARDGMRVLHVTPYALAGGVESWIRTLALAMPSVSHSVVAPHTALEGARMLGGVCDLWYSSPAQNPHAEPAREWLRAYLRAHPEHDILHLAYDRGLYDVARADGRPVVLTVHSCGYGWLRDMPAPDATVYVSQAMQSELGLPGTLIYNGVDLAAFSSPPGRRDLRAELGIGADEPVVIWVSRLHATKGLHALEIVARDLTEAGVHLIAIGHGQPDTEAWMRSLAGDLQGLHWLRYVGPAEMPDAYAAADALLHTAPREGFGLVAAEAQASGRPVVALAAPGISEVVNDGVTGLLCTEAAGLVRSVMSLVDDPRRRMAMGACGADRCRRLFDAQEMAAGYQAIYGGLV